MDKKAATPVAAFLLLNGAFKTGNNDISARAVANFISGGMRVKGMISFLHGLSIGYLVSKPSIRYH
jgi:hypothetical protein